MIKKEIALFTQGSYGINALKQLFSIGYIPSSIIVITDNSDKSNLPLLSFLSYFKIDFIIEKNKNNIYNYLSKFDFYFLLSISNRIILNHDLIKLPNKNAINLHPGLLPEYRGCFSIPWALINKAKVVGYTYHIMTTEIDGGEIIFKKEFLVEANDNAFKLNFKIMLSALEYLPYVIKKFECLNRSSNDITLGVYYKNEFPYNGFMSLEWDEELIERFFRASFFPPYNAVKLKWGGKIFEFETIEEFKLFKKKLYE